MFNTPAAVGGQALIEGVMMKSKRHYALALRKKDGTINLQVFPFRSLADKIPFLKLPFLRGIINFGEMMYLGIKSLTFSAEAFEDESTKAVSGSRSIEYVFTLLISFLLAAGIFIILPSAGLEFFIPEKEHPVIFNLVRSLIKLLFFLLYIFVISFSKDIKRVFQYHGAEHKAVNLFETLKSFPENGINASAAMRMPTFHPRCGTSFIFFVILISVFTYTFTAWQISAADYLGLTSGFSGKLLRIAEKAVLLAANIIFLPVSAAIAYEAIRLSFRFSSNRFFSWLLLPGRLFQMLTSREPDETMVECASTALNGVMAAEKASN